MSDTHDMSESLSIKEEKYYRLVNDDVVLITTVHETPWGIHGEYITGTRRGQLETWNDETYPYRMSWNAGDTKYSLTYTEVTIDKNPEVFL